MKFESLLVKAMNREANSPVKNKGASSISGNNSADKLVAKSAASPAPKTKNQDSGGPNALTESYQLGQRASATNAMQSVEDESINQGYGQSPPNPTSGAFQAEGEPAGMEYGELQAPQQMPIKYLRPVGQDYIDRSSQLSNLFKKSLLQ